MTMKTKLEKLFLREKPVKLLLSLKTGKRPKYVSVMAKETDCTYSHTVKILSEFEKLGIIFFDKKGRVKFVDLTKQGTEIADRLEDLMRAFTKARDPEDEEN